MRKMTLFYWIAAALFVIAFLLDWYFISLILKKQPYITHWEILFPFLITLVFTFGIISLWGMYLRSQWGFIFTYLILAFYMFFICSFYMYSLTPLSFLNVAGVMLVNIVVAGFIVFFHVKEFLKNQ